MTNQIINITYLIKKLMKKLFLLATSAILLASCASDAIVEQTENGPNNVNGPISFVMQNKNMTRATTALNKAGHYNFGVFAYKSGDAVNNIMNNYLVGYMDATNSKGYKFGAGQTTQGDAAGEYNGKSMWQYEMLGSSEYDYTGTEGYYTKDQTEYMSNEANQYLRYWDLSSATTTFYAYAPYVNSTVKVTATYDNSTKKLTIPDGTIEHAYVEGEGSTETCEYMYAATQVAKADYGKDVQLVFKRLNAKVNIKFWEDIQGYSVRILNLTSDYGVSAAPAIQAGSAGAYTYTQGEYFAKSGFVIDYSTFASPVVTQATGTTTQDALKFTSPTEEAIGTTRIEATKSPTTYYAIPKSNTTGFTFHVSYELISTTGERIKVQDATVFVPTTYTNWESNTAYTYIFKITKGSNGTTGNPGSINPNAPDVKKDEALYPIVFDNCTVEDWVENESDHVISGDTETTDYSVVLSSTGFAAGTHDIKAATDGSITVKLYEDDAEVSSPAGTWAVTGPVNTLSVSGGAIAIPAGTAAGEYTVTYTLHNDEKHTYHNHSDTYTAKFYVIGNYTVSVSTAEIGTGGVAATTLQASTTEAGVAETTLDGTFSIVYPTGIPADKKNEVTVSSTGVVTVGTAAYAGDYQVSYKTSEGTCYAAFAVKDFGFTLSTNSIGLSQADQDITIVGGANVTSPSTSAYTITSGTDVSIDSTTGTVTVKKTGATGTYTVTRTVKCKATGTADTDASTTEYTRTFTVKNVYELSLDKYTVDNDVDTFVQVTAKTNGASVLTGVTVSGGLSYDSTTGKIAISSSTPAGTYTVTYNGETKSFVVQD